MPVVHVEVIMPVMRECYKLFLCTVSKRNATLEVHLFAVCTVDKFTGIYAVVNILTLHVYVLFILLLLPYGERR